MKWRRGGPPSGAYLWAILELASGVPGGFELMLYGRDGAEIQETGKGACERNAGA